MYKNIVRYATFGKPVLIGTKPKPEPEPEPESVAEEPESEVSDEPQEETDTPEPEPEPEPERGIPQEVLDQVFAEIEEIDKKLQLTEETLRDARKTKSQADQLKKQAQKIRDEARAESEKLLEDTKLEAEKLLEQVRKEGYDAGYEDGKQQGIEDGKAQIEDELANIVRQANDKAQKTIQDAKERTSEYFIRAENDIVKVLMIALNKILPKHFFNVPQVVLLIVREAITRVRDQKEIKIHVEPNSYDLVLMALSELQSMLTDSTAILEVVSDESLKPGDCVIETPNGSVDARISTQLELMKSAVQNVLDNPM